MRELNTVLEIVVGVTGFDPLAQTRKRPYVFTRMLYVRVLDITHNGHGGLRPFTLSEMGHALGKDHATILHYRKEFDSVIAYEPIWNDHLKKCLTIYPDNFKTRLHIAASNIKDYQEAIKKEREKILNILY